MKKLTEQELEYLKAKYPNEYGRYNENSLKAYQKKESRRALIKETLLIALFILAIVGFFIGNSIVQVVSYGILAADVLTVCITMSSAIRGE